MNLLKTNLIQSTYLFPTTRWRQNSAAMQLFVSQITHFSISDCQHHQNYAKLKNIGEIHHENIRSFSRNQFEKVLEFINDNKKKFQNFNRRREIAFCLYTTIDTIDFEEFYNFLQLPDTFYSWFVIMELHIWILMSQLMDNQKSSQSLRNQLVEVMWVDVEQRCLNLGPIKKKKVKEQLRELNERLPISLLMYDEGLLSTDSVLAAALWFQLFEKQIDDPIKIEVLVRYIRHQVQHMSGLELKDFDAVKNIQNVWLPFSNHVKAVTEL